ncbi:MAG: UDP-N-acetylmuramate dehydrogenase [Bacteroidota bacterium]|nr:UDP-N-acetylmuramate dehydrogenase [Bacteroidota bacterium]
MISNQLKILENIILARYTTLNLGGAAKYFCTCSTVDELKEALQFARSKKIRSHILGGGSNTIFADDGFNGLIIKIDLKGVSFVEDGNDIHVTAKAGEEWDHFVKQNVEQGFAGVECLSGIPGSVGASPIQNVGAYGQEVKETIEQVKVLDRTTLQEKVLQNGDCGFSYRQSIFKTDDANKFIIVEAIFRLKKNGRPTIHYPEVKKNIEASIPLSTLGDGRESLEAVRNIVLGLRKKKSMAIDPSDVNTRSAGSFFLNPIVDEKQLAKIIHQWEANGDGTPIPTFASESKIKIPAAWLIEKSGFKKGYSKNGVGISENHTLALVNRSGTTKALLALAKDIQDGVGKQFGIRLAMEPVIVS